MNYYEELGIRPDADTEEIRKAHRRMVKLMHPDQHRDQGLKQLAETQMRRLNSIVATLLDPEDREEYDEQLRGDSAGSAPRQSTWRSLPWWIASTLGAIVLTVGAVWFWADRMGSSMGAHTPVVIESPETPDSTTVPVPLPPAREQPRNAQSGAQSSSTPTLAPEPAKPKPAIGDQAREILPPLKPKVSVPPRRSLAKSVEPRKIAKLDTARNTLPAQRKLGPVPLVSHVDIPQRQWDLGRPPTPGGLAAPPAGDSVDIVIDHGHIPGPGNLNRTLRHDPLEGEWVYAPTEPEKRKPGFYPPEFIKLKLVKGADGMHGVYNARYNVADSRPVSPEVSFALKSVDKDSRKYLWTAADGRHGTFEIRLLEGDTMRLEWRTTGGRSGPALNSGMATLVRKN
jgi:hypothetical protein